MELVAVDLGGTHARFALAALGADGTIALGEPVTLATRDFPGLPEAWRAFAETRGGALPAAASVAIAAPVTGEAIRFTNNAWTLRPATLAGELAVERLVLLNDFAAVGHAVARAGAEHFVHLCGPDAPPAGAGVTSIVGPGTGLGVAQLWRDGAGRARVQATEGGHIGFAPADAVEDAILADLRRRHGRVSLERVVSGPGIVAIHAALGGTGDDDRAIWSAGLAGSDPVAAAAVERFCGLLGAAAGDFALAHGADSVVIAGGLGLRLREILTRSPFAARLTDKGRFRELLSGLSVRLIVHPQPGLFGAAAAFASEHAS